MPLFVGFQPELRSKTDKKGQKCGISAEGLKRKRSAAVEFYQTGLEEIFVGRLNGI